MTYFVRGTKQRGLTRNMAAGKLDASSLEIV